jgi:hypothetical protein
VQLFRLSFADGVILMSIASKRVAASRAWATVPVDRVWAGTNRAKDAVFFRLKRSGERALHLGEIHARNDTRRE